MKKKTLALFGAVAFAGVALASCSKAKNPDDPSGDDTEGRVHVADAYYSGSDNSSGEVTWAPKTLSEVQSAYQTSGSINAWITYSKTYGTTFNDVIADTYRTNPIDNVTYSAGNTLPAWKEFATKLGFTAITQGSAYGSTLDDTVNYNNFVAAKNAQSGQYIDKNGDVTDIFYNTTSNLNKLGDANELVDLTTYLNQQKMPAFAKFLEDNPEIRTEITHNGKIFYTPYLDGYQAIERNFMMDTTQVEKLLDTALPTGTGLLAAGKDGAEKGLKSEPKAEQFIGEDGYNYDKDMQIAIVNPSTSQKVTVTVHKTDNILKLQNEALKNGTTGGDLIAQFKTYAQAAYGDIINTYYGGKISKMFTSAGACYNADDLVALLRIFKANPDVLYGSADVYDEVVPVFPRGQANNRVENILNFGATLYGVQGRGSEYDHLFFGADGKIHDFDTQQSSYDMLDKLHALYEEGLIQANFWAGSGGSDGINNFFIKKNANKSTFGLMEYDYIATQAAANDLKDGVGTAPSSRKTSASGFDFSEIQVRGVAAVLSPLTYVSTEQYSYDQKLDNNTGKTLCRYYEENRAVKNTSWSIPKTSDNIETAIALMDFMFTKEGWEIQNFGPQGYWTYVTVLGEANTPVLNQAILNHFSSTGIDFWNYCRGFLGTTQGIGHYRPTTLDYQATNYYAREGYANLTLAAKLGVQMTSRSVGNAADITWHTSMPMAVFSTMSTEIANTYAGVSTFWAQGNKATKDGSQNGWVAIVANGSSYASTVVSANNVDYQYKDIMGDQRTVKNTSYLNSMASSMGNAYIPNEAKKA